MRAGEKKKTKAIDNELNPFWNEVSGEFKWTVKYIWISRFWKWERLLPSLKLNVFVITGAWIWSERLPLGCVFIHQCGCKGLWNNRQRQVGEWRHRPSNCVTVQHMFVMDAQSPALRPVRKITDRVNTLTALQTRVFEWRPLPMQALLSVTPLTPA